MYRSTLYRVQCIWRAWQKGRRDEAAGINGGCTGKGQINCVREFELKALEPNKTATEVFLYLNGCYNLTSIGGFYHNLYSVLYIKKNAN